jgi:hypothetical protein
VFVIVYIEVKLVNITFAQLMTLFLSVLEADWLSLGHLIDVLSAFML